MDNSFISFKDAIEAMKLTVEKPRARSQRAELFGELYAHYEKGYKKDMWMIYGSWLKKNRYKHSKERMAEFQKSKLFRKKIPVKTFCSYWLGHIKTDDIYYLISIAKDKEHRRENFNRWLFWSIKSVV